MAALRTGALEFRASGLFCGLRGEEDCSLSLSPSIFSMEAFVLDSGLVELFVFKFLFLLGPPPRFTMRRPGGFLTPLLGALVRLDEGGLLVAVAVLLFSCFGCAFGAMGLLFSSLFTLFSKK